MNLKRERESFYLRVHRVGRMITGLPSGGSRHICSQLTFCFVYQPISSVYREALRLHFINISAGLKAKTESQQR